MTSPTTDETRESNTRQIILAAITAAGPVDAFTATDGGPQTWTERVHQLARDFTKQAHPSSALTREVKELERCRPYPAIVVSVGKEKSTKRGLVKLKVKPSRYAKTGEEEIRTDFMDVYNAGPDGVNKGPGVAMARRARALIGHHVTVWGETERDENGEIRGKVMRDIDDLGPADADAQVG